MNISEYSYRIINSIVGILESDPNIERLELTLNLIQVILSYERSQENQDQILIEVYSYGELIFRFDAIKKDFQSSTEEKIVRLKSYLNWNKY